ncbi:MAG: response regulator [Ferruginibacter sp.]
MVEDNEGDIILTLEAFKEAKIINSIDVVTDGELALMYLAKEGKYIDVETPDIILLDINLPKIDGLEVLKSIKNDPKLSLIPVIILTTSDDDKDILKSYQAHANCYITKPVSYNSFIDVIKTLNDFWIKIVKLPNV